MNYGLLEVAQELKAFILGQAKVPFIPYQEDGNWEPYLPKYENQTTKLGQETSGCTVWGSQNQIETLYKRVYGEEPNYSERFTYLNVPIAPSRGADPQNTYEAIRKHGLVNESVLPMTRTLQEYTDSSQITGSMRAKGLYWLQQHEFMHEWLWEPNARPANYVDVLKEALKTSPLGVSVSAWNRQIDEHGNEVYVSDQGSVNNHFCVLWSIDKDEYPWVYDSYDHSKKRLSKDHNIRRAKRIWINRKTVSASRRHISVLQDILKKLKLMKPTLLDVCKANLGEDVSEQYLKKDTVDDEVACAETVSILLKQVYPTMPIITGTYTLWQHMKSPTSNFVALDTPEPGCIVISPTGTGKFGTVGHVGIFDDNGIIMSNNSFGTYKGLFTQNFDLVRWKKRYTDTQGMPVYYFKHV